MKWIVLVLAVGCLTCVSFANDVIVPKFVKPPVKSNPPYGFGDIDNCGCHDIVAKLKKVEANLVKLILNMRTKYGSVYSELLDMKKHVNSVSWYVGQTSETAQSINEQLVSSSISLAQIMHSIRDLTISQQKLVTKTLLTESILILEKRNQEYKPPAPEGDIVYTSCDDERITQTGTYLVQDAFAEPTKVICVLDSQSGAFTVIQNRQNGSTDFYRGYSDYRSGFGEFDGGDYWLGLDRIHNMTSSGDYELVILMEDFEKNVSFARYDNFAIGTGNDFYPITKLDGFSGPAGDSFGLIVGVLFSAYDLDLDSSVSNCAVSNRGAWWYTDCGQSNLNGLYLKGLSGGTTGMFWETFRGANYSLKNSRMMIQRKPVPTTTDATTTATESTSMTTTIEETTATTTMSSQTVFTSTTPSESTIASGATSTSTTAAGSSSSTTVDSGTTTMTTGTAETTLPETTNTEVASTPSMPDETTPITTVSAESSSPNTSPMSTTDAEGAATTSVPSETTIMTTVTAESMPPETTPASTTAGQSFSTTSESSEATPTTTVVAETTLMSTVVPDTTTEIIPQETTEIPTGSSDASNANGASGGNGAVEKLYCNYNCTIYLRGQLINVEESSLELVNLNCKVAKSGIPCCTKNCYPVKL
uniref:Fibrinogen C-terminal domain-containing protein n=1 Tax=Anopheles minimus TaxID=112268 RepID=A0A182WQP4_9DIPT